MRNEPIESTYYRAVEDAERKQINEKADAIIQKRMYDIHNIYIYIYIYIMYLFK